MSGRQRVLLERLGADHDVSAFNSGNDILDAMLLAAALRKAVAAGEVAAARLVVGYAIDEAAAAFYERYGFIRAPEHPLRLYLRMKDARASLDSHADS